MFTEEGLKKARIDLYNIVANMSAEDYIKTNYKNGKRRSKNHIPYTLSQETEEAKKVYNMVCGADITDITADQEEEIKYYLLSFRLHRTEYLKDAGGVDYYI